MSAVRESRRRCRLASWIRAFSFGRSSPDRTPTLVVWVEDLPRREEIGHLRLLSLQEPHSRLASEERDEILSADAKQLLASFVPLRLRSPCQRNPSCFAYNGRRCRSLCSEAQRLYSASRVCPASIPERPPKDDVGSHGLFAGTLLDAAHVSYLAQTR